MAGGFRHDEVALQALEHGIRQGFYGFMAERWDEGRLLPPPVHVEAYRDDYRLRYRIEFLMDGREMLTLTMAEDCNVMGNLGSHVSLRMAHELWEREYFALVQEKTHRFFAEARMAARMSATLHESLDPEEFHRRLQEAIDGFYERRHRGNTWAWAPHLDSFHLVYRSDADLWGAIHDYEESRGRSTVNARMQNLATMIRQAANLVPDPGRFIDAVFRRNPTPGRSAPRQEPIYLMTHTTTEASLTEELAGTVANLSDGERAALQRQMSQGLGRLQEHMNQDMARMTLNAMRGAPLMSAGGGGGAYGGVTAYQESLARQRAMDFVEHQSMSLAQARNLYGAAHMQQDMQGMRIYAQQLQDAQGQAQLQMVRERVNPYLESVQRMMGVDSYLESVQRVMGIDFADGPDETAVWAYRYRAAARNDFAGEFLGRWDNGVAAAEQKGMRVLRESLNAEQLASLDQRGFFEVRGGRSGKTYRIRTGRQMNIDEMDGRGRKVCGWCFVPKGGLVTGDVMLTQKLALELQETEALQVANRF